MKFAFTLILSVFYLVTPLFIDRAKAQVPDRMSYQAVVRNTAGELITNHSVGIKIQVLQGSASGTAVYVETHIPTTNENGLFSIEIGGGTIVSGNFGTIDWSQGPYFIKTEADPDGGTNYTITGISQLLSVPYALYAKHSGDVGSQGPKGDTGVAGPQGPQGLPGPSGAGWLAGSGPASVALGEINDFYLNTLNGDYYKKTALNTWTFQGNLKGPIGLPGTNGTIWLTGKGLPGITQGKINDLYLDTAGGKVYQKQNDSSWVFATNLTGQKGENGEGGTNGTNGATWFVRGGSPDASLGMTNDLYLDTSSGAYYKKIDLTTWIKQGNLKGINGKDGATWFTGAGLPDSIGALNDLYMDTTNGYYYKKISASTWSFQSNLTGEKGTAGSVWYSGSGTPSTSLGVINDMYLDSLTAMYYTKTSSTTWVNRGALLGPAHLSGKKNYVLKFTSKDTAGNSQIYDSTYIGINTNKPKGKLHIKGAEDISQLVIDANSSQDNKSPMIRLRNSNGNDLIWIHSDDSTNLFFGRDAGRVNVLGSAVTFPGYNNTFIGSRVGYSNTSGKANTGTGSVALLNNTTGNYNTANGYEALYNNTSGTNNTAIGAGALNQNTTTGENTAIGFRALYNNAGTGNTATGSSALYYNILGGFNTASGDLSLFNSTGSYNTASGYESLSTNTKGSNNTVSGYYVMRFNTTGSMNTAYGQEALYSNKAGSNGTAIGYGAMYYANNTSTAFTNYNVAVGYEAMKGSSTASTNTGNSNTTIGYQSIWNNTTGSYNSVIGLYALYSNTTGSHNSVSGYNALYSNTKGTANTVAGSQAMYSNTTGGSNTANGQEALYSNTTGLANTGIGSHSLWSNDGGDSLTAIGFSTNVNAGNYGNSSAFGNGATITARDQVRIGNSAVASIGGQVSWSTLSDRRVKTNVEYTVPGLAFITKLKPVTYTYDFNNVEKIVWPNGKPTFGNGNDSAHTENPNENVRFTGFIAQDVEDAARSIGYSFSGVDAPKNEKDLYGLRYSDFVVPLVKAVQEQQEIIEQLQAKNAEYDKVIIELQKKVGELRSGK